MSIADIPTTIQQLRNASAASGTSLTAEQCSALIERIAPPPSDFAKELESLINRHSMENASDTPDFILAHYLAACLAAFNTATRDRETWYGRAPSQFEMLATSDV